MTVPNLIITPIAPPEPPVGFGLAGDAKQSDYTSGTTSFLGVNRPRRPDYTEFQGTSLMQLDIPVLLDGAATNTSVEAMCNAVESWKVARTSTGQPPILALHGPVPGTHRQWVLETTAWSTAIRRITDGERIQQTLTLTLVEYVDAQITFVSPAAAAQARQQDQTAAVPGAVPPPAGAHRAYIVAQGDTLSSIAAKLLGSWSDWTKIAAANNLRDPNAIIPGQRLLIP